MMLQWGRDARALADRERHRAVVAYLNTLAKKRKPTLEAAEQDNVHIAAMNIASVRPNAVHPANVVEEQKRRRTRRRRS